MERSAWFAAMVEFGRALDAPPSDADRLTFLHGMVEHGRRLLAKAPPPEAAAVARAADLDAFRRLVMADPRGLHWRVLGKHMDEHAKLAAERREWLRVLEIEPDLLGPMDEVRYEPIHTRLMAYFLSPVRLPVLGTAPLLAFVELLRAKGAPLDPPDPASLKGVHARPEESLGESGRVDVWLDLPVGLVLVELKVDAAERQNQLTDYRTATLGDRRADLVVFLTIGAEQRPSDELAAHVTYQDVLAAWLPIAVAGETGEHLYLRRYLKTLARGLCSLAGTGAFHEWTWAERRAALAFLSGSMQ